MLTMFFDTILSMLNIDSKGVGLVFLFSMTSLLYYHLHMREHSGKAPPLSFFNQIELQSQHVLIKNNSSSVSFPSIVQQRLCTAGKQRRSVRFRYTSANAGLGVLVGPRNKSIGELRQEFRISLWSRRDEAAKQQHHPYCTSSGPCCQRWTIAPWVSSHDVVFAERDFSVSLKWQSRTWTKNQWVPAPGPLTWLRRSSSRRKKKKPWMNDRVSSLWSKESVQVGDHCYTSSLKFQQGGQD